MKLFKNYQALFWLSQGLLVLIKIAFTLRPEIDLFTEEAQYWLWSQNLAWHYYSKPPMVAVFNYLSTSLFGVSELSVRLVPILFGLGSSWLIFQLAFLLVRSQKIAFWASLILASMPFFLLFTTFHMTDSELMFFWVLTWFFLAKALQSQEWKWWLFAGLAAAFGLASKPIMILVLPALGLYLLLKGQLKTFFSKGLVFTGVLLLGFLPSLIWNVQNDFQTFKHIATLGGVQGEEEATRSFLEVVIDFLTFVGSQLGVVSLILLPLLWIGLKTKAIQRMPSVLLLTLPILVTLLLFGAMSLLTEVLANWPAFCYPPLAIVLAFAADQQSEKWRKVRNWGIAIGLGLPVLLLLPEAFGWKKATRLELAEVSVFRRMTGYEDIAHRVEYLKDSLGVVQPFYFSESYHVASELAFYLPDHPQPYQAEMGSRRNQFDLWEGLENEVGRDKVGVFVSLHQDSPEAVTTFENLVYEEEFPIYFRDVFVRNAKIQFWSRLQSYDPVVIDSY